MSRARRAVGCWLLAAFLERGCDPTTVRLPEPVRRERPLTPAELRALSGPPASLHFLRRAAGRVRRPPTDAGTGRLLAFPLR